MQGITEVKGEEWSNKGQEGQNGEEWKGERKVAVPFDLGVIDAPDSIALRRVPICTSYSIPAMS